ncbi:MAG: choice-of-anchor D domain-containing protein [Boseongicola sp.]|nr:MAG: choice-of-anchor D domain-containing protein [Boseongicola sp.]
MACNPFPAPSFGLFIDNVQGIWASTDEAHGDRSCDYTGGTLVVSGPNGSMPFTAGGSQVVRHKFFGSNNYLAVLFLGTGIGPQTATVVIVDFVASSITTKIALMTSVPQNQIPWLQFSQGTGSACLIGAPGTINTAIGGIFRSDTGDLLCGGVVPFIPTLEISGEAIAGATQIKHGGTVIAGPCPNPSGQLNVTPSSRNFGTVKLGGCAQPAATEQFTLQNSGTDCLTINGIQDVAPYSVISTSTGMPAELEPGESMTATVLFDPAVTGIYNNVTLPVATVNNSGGDSELECDGRGEQAEADCSVSPGAVNFGHTPVGTIENAGFTVTNSGDVPISVTIAGAPPGAVFQWSGTNANLTCGQSVTVPVAFSPTAEGPVSANISVGVNPGSNKTVVLNGEGCIPNAVIQAPPAPFPAFGEVRRGYRMVKFIKVENTGDDTLVFTASISGADAALFGILQSTTSITDVVASRTFSVDPTQSCGSGPIGDGEVIVPVVFYADGAPPATANALLTINNHNDASAAASFDYTLSGDIIAGNVVDAVAVLDRSGSMDDAIPGGGTKMQAAIHAGRLLVNLMPPDIENRVAATSYSTNANTFLGIDEITAGNQGAKVNAINAGEPELVPDGWTAIAAGMMVGEKEFAVPRAGAMPAELVKAMIVLTDGLDNTAYLNPDDNRHYSILGGQARDPANTSNFIDTEPYAPPGDVDIYGIGLGTGENIDTMQLASISSAAGGYYGTVDPTSPDTLFQLMKFYTQIYMDLVDTSTIEDPKTTIQAGEKHAYEFDVLRGDVSGMVVVYDLDGLRVPFWLETPLGEIVDPSTIPADFALRAGATEASRFVEFQLPAKEPKRYAGRWKLIVQHDGRVCRGTPDARETQRMGFLPEKCGDSKKPVDYGFAIGVGSNFRLQAYLSAGSVNVGDPITMTAVPTEAGLPVLGCTVTVDVRAPNGQEWTGITLSDGAVPDGEYAGVFTPTAQAGSYTFKFRATGYSRDGEPVKREVVRAKYVQGAVRQPPATGNPGGSMSEECCKRIIKILEKNNALLGKNFGK